MKSYLKNLAIQNYVGVFLLVVFILFFANFASAQDAPKYVSLVSLPGFNDGETEGSLPGLINSIYLLSIGLGALLGVIKIAIAGVKYSMSDIVTDKASAKRDILGVLLGLLILLMPYIVLNEIYPNLTNLNFLDRIQPIGNGGGNANPPGPSDSTYLQNQIRDCSSKEDSWWDFQCSTCVLKSQEQGEVCGAPPPEAAQSCGDYQLPQNFESCSQFCTFLGGAYSASSNSCVFGGEIKKTSLRCDLGVNQEQCTSLCEKKAGEISGFTEHVSATSIFDTSDKIWICTAVFK